MKFKNFELIIGNCNPTKEDIKKICEFGSSKVKDYCSNHYDVIVEFIEDRFLWLYSEYDNPNIYNEIVVNQENDVKEKNPKKKSQVELNKQLFMCYDINTNVLYTNNYDKKGFICHYINSALQKEVTIKNIFASLEMFQHKVKEITKLRFVQVDKLTNRMEGSIFKSVSNIFGLDIPNSITMQVEYRNMGIFSMKNSLQKFQQWKDAGQFENIVFTGKDDNNVEQTFDFNSMIKSIEIHVPKDENCKYDNNEVKLAFLKLIR